jgi:cyclic pyranopterin phosphate synthase
MGGLTHIDARGRARMVDVGDKKVTTREALAEAMVWMSAETRARIARGDMPKGDVLAVSRVAGIQAAKRTPELIPLCHSIALTSVSVNIDASGSTADESGRVAVRIVARARASDRTGVEMEALVAASVAALTLYDMCKAVERALLIGPVRLLEKRGGRSGVFRAPGHAN